jgi:Ca2+-binding RTX toxin-like protein
VTANDPRVRFDRINPAPFAVDIGTCESLVLNANGGNDTLACTGNLAALIQIIADGGAGDDTLLGSNGPDVLLGGDDNDFIDGQQGVDLAFLGAGDDTFQWDPGDGSDTVEGQDGHDVMVFNGSGAAEIFDFSANGQRLRFTRNIGNIVMDVDDVEQVDLQALGGADVVSVNDLSATDLVEANVDLAGILGGDVGDAEPDAITVNGTEDPDTIHVAANSGAVEVSGLAAFVRITHSEAANDLLTVNGLGGTDTITVGPGVDALIMVIINQ